MKGRAGRAAIEKMKVWWIYVCGGRRAVSG
jgi:hypothetical protein